LRQRDLRGHAAGYSLLDCSGNEDISEEPVENKLAHYKQKWLNHVSRMEDEEGLDNHGDTGRIQS
jgi:hypothetical protein